MAAKVWMDGWMDGWTADRDLKEGSFGSFFGLNDLFYLFSHLFTPPFMGDLLCGWMDGWLDERMGG